MAIRGWHGNKKPRTFVDFSTILRAYLSGIQDLNLPRRRQKGLIKNGFFVMRLATGPLTMAR